MTDWNFIALLCLYGLLCIIVVGYFAWQDYVAYKITKTAINKAIDIAKDGKHDMDK